MDNLVTWVIILFATVWDLVLEYGSGAYRIIVGLVFLWLLLRIVRQGQASEERAERGETLRMVKLNELYAKLSDFEGRQEDLRKTLARETAVATKVVSKKLDEIKELTMDAAHVSVVAIDTANHVNEKIADGQDAVLKRLDAMKSAGKSLQSIDASTAKTAQDVAEINSRSKGQP